MLVNSIFKGRFTSENPERYLSQGVTPCTMWKYLLRTVIFWAQSVPFGTSTILVLCDMQHKSIAYCGQLVLSIYASEILPFTFCQSERLLRPWSIFACGIISYVESSVDSLGISAVKKTFWQIDLFICTCVMRLALFYYKFSNIRPSFTAKELYRCQDISDRLRQMVKWLSNSIKAKTYDRKFVMDAKTRLTTVPGVMSMTFQSETKSKSTSTASSAFLTRSISTMPAIDVFLKYFEIRYGNGGRNLFISQDFLRFSIVAVKAGNNRLAGGCGWDWGGKSRFQRGREGLRDLP
ncbi:MAG: hypothetical protein JOS17DRAFT_780822 [Linnemannia elongata]|nr:MAG: hypothetical protein JOS17DRAFT_780822 [Linnemannia elongata]